MPEFYSADQVVGATLYARQRVPLKRFPLDSEPAYGEIMPGKMVGTVFSWLNPSSQRTALYWQFKDPNGSFYYAEHKTGRFSETALGEQGVLSVQDQIDQNAPPPTVAERVQKIAVLGLGLWIGSGIVKELIRSSAYRRARRDRFMYY